MAYIIGDDHEDRFIGTDVEFSEGDQALRAFFAQTRANPYTINRACWRTGTLIPRDVVPTKARVVKGDAIYDWCRMLGGACLVSARFKECVEELDPGRHGFFPLTVEDKQGTVKPGPYFLFNVVGCIDSIIEAQSNLKTSGRGLIASWRYERLEGPWKCAMDRSIIGDRACWTELHYALRWFVSDRLAELVQQRSLLGFALQEKCDEVSV